MTMICTYEFAVPDDAPDEELDGYREVAISTWRTAVEASGARPGEADAELVTVADPPPVRNRLTGEMVPGPARAWHVSGPAV